MHTQPATRLVVLLLALIALLVGVSSLSSTRWLSAHWDMTRQSFVSASEDATWDSSAQQWTSDTGDLVWDDSNQAWVHDHQNAVRIRYVARYVDDYGNSWEPVLHVWIDPTATYFWDEKIGAWAPIYEYDATSSDSTQ